MSRFTRLRRPGRRGFAAIAIALAAAISILVFASPFYVVNFSMESTLAPGELMLVDRMSTAIGVERGEIILFNPPTTSTEPFIKRVIGLPGETVAIHDGHVYINGGLLNEPYLPAGTTTKASSEDFRVTVPAGSVFVLGDNRSVALDSRNFGPVSLSSIIGQVWVAVAPQISVAFL